MAKSKVRRKPQVRTVKGLELEDTSAVAAFEIQKAQNAIVSMFEDSLSNFEDLVNNLCKMANLHPNMIPNNPRWQKMIIKYRWMFCTKNDKSIILPEGYDSGDTPNLFDSASDVSDGSEMGLSEVASLFGNMDGSSGEPNMEEMEMAMAFLEKGPPEDLDVDFTDVTQAEPDPSSVTPYVDSCGPDHSDVTVHAVVSEDKIVSVDIVDSPETDRPEQESAIFEAIITDISYTTPMTNITLPIFITATSDQSAENVDNSISNDEEYVSPEEAKAASDETFISEDVDTADSAETQGSDVIDNNVAVSTDTDTISETIGGSKESENDSKDPIDNEDSPEIIENWKA